MVLSQCFCHHIIIKEIKKATAFLYLLIWVLIWVLLENSAPVVCCAFIIVLF